jgi:hypothetical protein
MKTKRAGCCYDMDDIEIESGSFVYIEGDCKLTDSEFVLTEEMTKYINSGVPYKVMSVEPYRNKLNIMGYMWHSSDVRVSTKQQSATTAQTKITTFKFNEKLLDI